MLIFYFAYLHPYFDGNGRTARLFIFGIWFSRVSPLPCFMLFRNTINSSKQAYYNSFLQIESNAKISGRFDLTPFYFIFHKNVYSIN
jgi:Fic family protein